jgi:hypothetical protein
MYRSGCASCATVQRALLAVPAQVAPSALAREAYDGTLKPYHGWAISNVVRMALGMVPSRPQLLQSFGLPDEASAAAAMGRATAVMRPVVTTVGGWYASHGWDWPDKAGF